MVRNPSTPSYVLLHVPNNPIPVEAHLGGGISMVSSEKMNVEITPEEKIKLVIKHESILEEIQKVRKQFEEVEMEWKNAGEETEKKLESAIQRGRLGKILESLELQEFQIKSNIEDSMTTDEIQRIHYEQLSRRNSEKQAKEKEESEEQKKKIEKEKKEKPNPRYYTIPIKK